MRLELKPGLVAHYKRQASWSEYIEELEICLPVPKNRRESGKQGGRDSGI
jgi:hypothetical protein